MGTLGLLAGLGAPRLAAQTWALPASDPVGIARSGAGVAYGASLEAAALNPALLATLREPASAYLALGLELQAAKATLQTNQMILYSSDRNRSLPALGAAWRISPTKVLGLKLDEPFMRHAQMPLDYAGRFQGQALDLRTRRLEGQLGWAANPNWAFGASLGVTRIQYAWDNMVRTVVPLPSNPTIPLGLMETDLHQAGAKTVPSYSLGFRWAMNPRWTIGGCYVAPIKGTLPLSASYGSVPAQYYTLAGTQPGPGGIGGPGAALQAASPVRPGSGGITLPGKATLGVRQRVNQVFTWELDLRYILGSSTELPGYPTVTPPGLGPVSGTGEGSQFQNGLGMSLMGELNVSKHWVVRIGVSLDPALRQNNDVDPLVGGAKSAGLSAGFGVKCFGGELNAGYQYRQSQNVDVPNLEGTWPSSGYATTPATTRVEGMGHLLSVGFKWAF
jgi:long-subunit fatty acid transport protein